MGKFKDKSKKKSNRSRPTELPSNEEVLMDEELNPSVEKKYPVIRNLTSDDALDREYACSALASIVFEAEPEEMQVITSPSTLKKLIQSLVDPMLSIRTAAAGALRNMSIVGGEDVCEAMVKADIMTPLLHIFQQTHAAIVNLFTNPSATAPAVISPNTNSAPSVSPVELLKEYQNLVLQTLALFSYLIESSSQAAKLYVNSEHAVSLTFSFLRNQQVTFHNTILDNTHIAVAAGQLLHVVTDDNPPCANKILHNPEHVSVLQTVLGNAQANLQLRVLIAGIFVNITPPSSRLDCVKSILPVLSVALQFDAITELLKLEPQWISLKAMQSATENAENGTNTNTNTNNNQQQLTQSILRDVMSWSHLMKSQQLALEILTNICSEDLQADDFSNYEETGDDELESATNDNNNNNTAPSTFKINVPQDIVQFVVTAGLFQQVASKCGFVSDDILQRLQVLSSTTNLSDTNSDAFDLEVFTTTQQRALVCLGNMIMMLELPEMGDVAAIWNFLCDLCTRPLTNEAVSGAITMDMWSLLRRLVPTAPAFVPSAVHISGIVALAKTSPFESVRVHAVGMLGVIGQFPNMDPIIPEIGNVLLERLYDGSTEVAAEALNSIFDVFAEPNYNAVVQQLDMLNKLIKTLQVLKTKLQTEKRTMDRELFVRLDEAKINLNRFLKYKYEQFK